MPRNAELALGAIAGIVFVAHLVRIAYRPMSSETLQLVKCAELLLAVLAICCGTGLFSGPRKLPVLMTDDTFKPTQEMEDYRELE